MNDAIFCAECGVQILTAEDMGSVEEVVIVRSNLVGIPAAGSSVTYTDTYCCAECKEVS